MAQRWQDVEDFTVDMATDDLEQRGEVHPLLIAFAGDQQSFVAFLRPFPKGRYHHPMTELLSLAMALDCDRLAFAASGRLTSLDDPIPPVTAGADLRQRALVVEYADATDGTVCRHSLLHPFDHAGGVACWGDPVRLDGASGWIPQVLGLSVERRRHLSAFATDADIRAQAERCVMLGHELYTGPQLAARLSRARAAVKGRGG